MDVPLTSTSSSRSVSSNRSHRSSHSLHSRRSLPSSRSQTHGHHRSSSLQPPPPLQHQRSDEVKSRLENALRQIASGSDLDEMVGVGDGGLEFGGGVHIGAEGSGEEVVGQQQQVGTVSTSRAGRRRSRSEAGGKYSTRAYSLRESYDEDDATYDGTGNDCGDDDDDDDDDDATCQTEISNSAQPSNSNGTTNGGSEGAYSFEGESRWKEREERCKSSTSSSSPASQRPLQHQQQPNRTGINRRMDALSLWGGSGGGGASSSRRTSSDASSPRDDKINYSNGGSSFRSKGGDTGGNDRLSSAGDNDGSNSNSTNKEQQGTAPDRWSRIRSNIDAANLPQSVSSLGSSVSSGLQFAYALGGGVVAGEGSAKESAEQTTEVSTSESAKVSAGADAQHQENGEKEQHTTQQLFARLSSLGKTVGSAVGSSVEHAANNHRRQIKRQSSSRSRSSSKSRQARRLSQGSASSAGSSSISSRRRRRRQPQQPFVSKVDRRGSIPKTIEEGEEDDTLFSKFALNRFSLARLVDETVPNADRLNGQDGSSDEEEGDEEEDVFEPPEGVIYSDSDVIGDLRDRSESLEAEMMLFGGMSRSIFFKKVDSEENVDSSGKQAAAGENVNADAHGENSKDNSARSASRDPGRLSDTNETMEMSNRSVYKQIEGEEQLEEEEEEEDGGDLEVEEEENEQETEEENTKDDGDGKFYVMSPLEATLSRRDSDEEDEEDFDARSAHSNASSVLEKVGEWKKELGDSSLGRRKRDRARNANDSIVSEKQRQPISLSISVRTPAQRAISNKNKVNALDMANMRLSRLEQRRSFAGSSNASAEPQSTSSGKSVQSWRFNER